MTESELLSESTANRKRILRSTGNRPDNLMAVSAAAKKDSPKVW